MTQAPLVPTKVADAPLIACLDSGLRTFYKGLQDSPGEGLPRYLKAPPSYEFAQTWTLPK